MRRLAPNQLIAVGLGGNIGDDDSILARFRATLRLLRAKGAFAISSSHIYKSAAAGPITGQPRFLNAVLGLRMPKSVDALDFLITLWSIERGLGRKRPSRPKQGPRRIDLDLLHWRGQTHDSPVLTVPHPRAALRSFVIFPLSEIASGTPVPDTEDCRRVYPPLV